jgi:hypothetical protein
MLAGKERQAYKLKENKENTANEDLKKERIKIEIVEAEVLVEIERKKEEEVNKEVTRSKDIGGLTNHRNNKVKENKNIEDHIRIAEVEAEAKTKIGINKMEVLNKEKEVILKLKERKKERIDQYHHNDNKKGIEIKK